MNQIDLQINSLKKQQHVFLPIPREHDCIIVKNVH